MSRDQKLKMKEIGKLVAHSCFMLLIFEEDSEKKSESQMGFEPMTLRDLVGCSNHLSYWRLWNRITGLHSQVMTGTQERTNSIALSP